MGLEVGFKGDLGYNYEKAFNNKEKKQWQETVH